MNNNVFIQDKIIMEKTNHIFKNLNLIFDLDQTLVHTLITPINDSPKKEKTYFDKLYTNLQSFIICEYDSLSRNYKVYGRKGIIEILVELKDYFNIYIYTNGLYSYAQKISDSIERLANGEIFAGLISRASQFSTEQKYIEVLPHFNINNTIIIDDRDDIWCINVHNNLIQIKEYIYGSNIDYFRDNDLLILKDLLLRYKDSIQDTNIHQIISFIKLSYNIHKN
jgi:TFIIF-interacting CTD phosphatase-like protein